MKKQLALITALVLVLSACAEKPRNDGETEPEEIIESTETAATSEDIAEKGTVWEGEGFSIKLKDGWKVVGDYAELGDKAEFRIDIMPYSDFPEKIYDGNDDKEALKAFREYLKEGFSDIDDYKQESFTIDGRDGIKLYYSDGYDVYILYFTVADSNLYYFGFSVSEDYGKDYADLDEMAKTFKAKKIPDGYMSAYVTAASVAILNSEASNLRNCINAWLAEKDGKGFSVDREAYFDFIIRVDEYGVFETYTSVEDCFKSEAPQNADADLQNKLQEAFPNMRSMIINVMYRLGCADGILLYSWGDYVDAYWDWDKSEWICEDAKTDGVTADGLIFGTWPAHRVE